MTYIKYEFQNTLHRNLSEMLDAIVEFDITANGSSSHDDIMTLFKDWTDDDLAESAAEEMGLFSSECGQSHADFNEYTIDDLAEHFRQFRIDYISQL